MINKTVCIVDVLDGGVPCNPYELQWIIPNESCIASPCDGCTTDCIDITVLDECEANSIQVIVTCPSCGVCDPVIKTITFCTTEGDCSGCEDCDDGVCVDICPDFCDENEVCVECLEDSDCPGDKECIQGACQCPQGTDDLGTGVCKECYGDGDCDDCEECIGDYCQPKQCFGKPCLNDECVDCIHSGHCGTNEVCGENNECECAPGFERNFENICVPKPTCEDSSDCADCYECVLGNCQPKICPEGYRCVNDECVEICNCLEDECGEGFTCTDIGFNSCVCLPCTECPDKGTPGSGTDPDPNNPNNPGTGCSQIGDCGQGEDCVRGACEDCDSCPEQDCVENFSINKDELSCKIEGILESSTPCSCPIITWSTEVYQRTIEQVSFRLRLRKGNAFTEGLNNIPLLGQTGIIGELPISGIIRYKVIEYGNDVGDSNSSWSRQVVNFSANFANVDTVITPLIEINKPGEVCLDVNSQRNIEINKVVVEFELATQQFLFSNGCSYGAQTKKIYYIVTKNGGNGFVSATDFFNTNAPITRYEVTQSNNKRNPIFSWYRLSSASPTGGQLIRKVYSDKVSEFKFRDAWLGLQEGFEIQKYYRLESDCACSGYTFYKCDGQPDKLAFCNPDITSLTYLLDNCNKKITLSDNTFTVCDSNGDYPQSYDLYLNGQIYDTFTPVGTTVEINGVYTLTQPVEEIEIKLSGIDCQSCRWQESVSSASLSVEVLGYDCDTDNLSIQITGGSGNYDIEVDGTPWTIGTPIDISTGSHTIFVEDTTMGCTYEEAFEVDCCAGFALTSVDTSVCGTSLTTYDFSVSGGDSDYVWEVRESEGGTLIDNGTSSTENITADLTGYSGTSFWIGVTDNKNCFVEDIVQVTYHDEVDVTASMLTYCSGEATHDIEVMVTSGQLPISYTLTHPSNPPQSGTITLTTDHITINNPDDVEDYTLELEDANGCEKNKAISLVSESCPDVFIAGDIKTICEGQDLILTAQITGGTAPYSWSIEYGGTEIANGNTSTISHNTGVIYSSADGTYDFDFFIEDYHGKTDSDLAVTMTVLDSSDPICTPCGAKPTVSLSSDVGWTVNTGDPVEITHDVPGVISQQWFIDSVSDGAGASYFPDTSVAGSYSIYVTVEYEAGCTADSDPYILTVTEPSCTCSVGIDLQIGWGSDNGSQITTNTTSGSNGCVGTALTAAITDSNCATPVTKSWILYKNGVQEDSGNTSAFNHTITSAGTYKLEVFGTDDDGCVSTAVSFTKTFVVCRTCDIYSDPISDFSICDGQDAITELKVYDKYSSAPIYRTIIVDGNTYSSGDNIGCTFSTTCNVPVIVQGLNPGVHTIIARAYEADEPTCKTEQTFQVTVKNISDPACQDCGDNTATITVGGQYGCSGNTCNVSVTEGNILNLSASATGTPGNFTYQWKTSGGSNVGSGQSSVNVGPFNYGQNPTYIIHVTDSEGCNFSKNINVDVSRDCSGSVSTSQSKNTACPSDSITLSWNLTNLYNYQQYEVEVWRSVSGSFGPFQMVQDGLDYNDTYNISMPNSSYHWYIKAIRGAGLSQCLKQSSTRSISLDTCVDCTGTVSSISKSPSTPICLTDEVDLVANVSGSTSGWTYTWRRGTSSGGAFLGTGLTLSSYEPPSLPETVSVWYTKTGCEGVEGSKSTTISLATGCCPDIGNIQVLNSNGSGSHDASRCKTDQVRLTLTGYDPTYTYTWRQNNSNGSILFTGYPLQYTKSTNSSETVWVGATKSGCPGDSASITITEDPTCCPDIGDILINGGSDTSRCKGENLTLSLSGNESQYTYTWRQNNGLGAILGTGSSLAYTKSTTGSETVWVGATDSKCITQTKTITITQDATCCPTIGNILVNGGSDASRCKNDVLSLTLSGGDPSYTYTWRQNNSSGSVLGTVSSLSYTKTTNGTETIWVGATSATCDPQSTTIAITEDSSCCPDLQGDGMISQPYQSPVGYKACVGEPIDMYVYVNPTTDPEYTFAWYLGQSATGTPISTDQVLTWSKTNTGTEYITGVVSHPNCPDTVVTKAFTLASTCCPTSTPIISTQCGTGQLTLQVSNTSSQDKIRFNSGAWQTGGTTRSFNVTTPGNSVVTVEVSRDYCDDPLIYNVNVVL